MTPERTITFRLPEPLLSSAVRAARAEEMTAAEFIRAAVESRLAQREAPLRIDAIDTPREALRRDIAEAGGWIELQRRLRARKLVLRDCDGELVLMSWPVECRLMPLARLGITREALTLLYRAPFPAHGPGKSRPAPLRLENPLIPANDGADRLPPLRLENPLAFPGLRLPPLKLKNPVILAA